MQGNQQRDRIDEFKGAGAIVIGSLLIILGIGAAVLEGVLYYYNYVLTTEFYNYLIFGGVWSGAIFVVTGIIAILAGAYRNQCLIITSLVMSILAILPSIALIWISGAVIRFHTSVFTVYPEQRWRVRHGIDGALVAIGVVSGVLCVVCSILCCAAVCCGRRNPYPQQFYQGAGNTEQMPSGYGQQFHQNPGYKQQENQDTRF